MDSFDWVGRFLLWQRLYHKWANQILQEWRRDRLCPVIVVGAAMTWEGSFERNNFRLLVKRFLNVTRIPLSGRRVRDWAVATRWPGTNLS